MPSYRYHCADCFKTYIGPQLPNKMTCNCAKPKKISGTLHIIQIPLSEELLEILNSSQAAKMRNALCQNWGIINKSHVQHGANFSSNQTVVNLIHDIVSPVTGALRHIVRDAIIRDYRYDIDSQQMV